MKYVARIGLYLFVIFLSFPARAAQYDIWNIPETSSSFAGGYTALANSAGGPPYYYTDEWAALFEPTSFSFLSIYDTGASGLLLSYDHRVNLAIPLTGEEYSDVGIGGYEFFDVSVPTYIRLCPSTMVTDVDNLYIQDPNHYAEYGQFKMQVSQNATLPVDVIGTPILAHQIMHVNLDDWRDMSLTSGVVVAYTEFLPAMPTTFAGPKAFPVPLRMDNFITGTPPISADVNPMIPGVRVRDHRKGPDNQSEPKDWLLDTGAQLTMIGRDYATQIGIDLVNEVPFDSVEIQGVGGTIMIYGYILDEVVLPAQGGDELSFHNVVAFVPEEGALPADLTGIFGMNTLSGNMIDDGVDVWIVPNFIDWYFDGPGQTLWLVPDLVTVEGTITLQDYPGNITAVPVTIEIRDPDNTTAVETHTVNLDANGHYSFLTNLKWDCDLAAKPPHWLRQKHYDNITGPQTVDFTLINGDCDGDNEINSTDLSILLGSMNAAPGDPRADLDGDGEVTSTDLSIVLEDTLSGDVNKDGQVDATDMAIVLSNMDNSFGQGGYDSRADLDGDGAVTIADLPILLRNMDQLGDP